MSDGVHQNGSITTESSGAGTRPHKVTDYVGAEKMAVHSTTAANDLVAVEETKHNIQVNHIGNDCPQPT